MSSDKHQLDRITAETVEHVLLTKFDIVQSLVPFLPILHSTLTTFSHFSTFQSHSTITSTQMAPKVRAVQESTSLGPEVGEGQLVFVSIFRKGDEGVTMRPRRLSSAMRMGEKG